MEPFYVKKFHRGRDLPLHILVCQRSVQYEMVRQADPAVAALYRKRFPEDPAMTSLGHRDRLEAEHTMIFGGLYQAWVRARA
ncbi:hypothetical protein [Azospirillum sp. TSA6c]|uniref:hypothetical protein n=1 Tax=unclassified Azospirillum TaxID=2630922 RepID=UPI000D60A9C6|nr:hypothetical protein [Azospirillum sp. TSA6c]PWC53387.1 hypothetical protein TSA6c_02430 [Azospirillum sp. TSA6c]